MRLWSLKLSYLDGVGLVALWREALLARAVLRRQTQGYRNHPQLERFRAARDPLAAIEIYLVEVLTEARRRGYRFDESKVDPCASHEPLELAAGQLEYEFNHLLLKLRVRCKERFAELEPLVAIEANAIFRVVDGGVASWERLPQAAHRIDYLAEQPKGENRSKGD